MGGRDSLLSESEKNELVLQYQNVVYYFANRYRFFDPEIEEVQAWGFLGLAKAIHRIERDSKIDLETIVFSTIRKEILDKGNKYKTPKSETSLQSVVTGGDSRDAELGQFIAAGDNSFDIYDIKEMIEMSLFEQGEQFKQINLDYYLTPKNISEIAIKHNVTEPIVSRMRRQGQALIKLYLVNNDIILNYSSYPSEERKKKEMIVNHKELLTDHFGKVKYIRRHFSFLSINDMALLMGTSPYMIEQILDYPTTTYMQSSEDDSIADKALKYCQKNYPERLPSKVKVYEMV